MFMELYFCIMQFAMYTCLYKLTYINLLKIHSVIRYLFIDKVGVVCIAQ